MNFIELKDQTQSDPGIILEYYRVKIQLKHEFNKIVLKECLHCLRGAFLLSIAGNARIFFFQKPVDMRKGVESLSVLIEQSCTEMNYARCLIFYSSLSGKLNKSLKA